MTSDAFAAVLPAVEATLVAGVTPNNERAVRLAVVRAASERGAAATIDLSGAGGVGDPVPNVETAGPRRRWALVAETAAVMVPVTLALYLLFTL